MNLFGKFISTDEDKTRDIGKQLAEKLVSGDVVVMKGALGVGKSVFVRGVIEQLGVTDVIPSPTFTIVNEYMGKFKIFHFDLYRINDPFELYETGFEEYIYSDGITFIEWPEKAGELLPEQYYCVEIEITEDDNRQITITKEI